MLKANSMTASIKEKLGEFVKLIGHLSNKSYKTAADMLKDIVEMTGYIDDIEEERLQHIMELTSSAETMMVKDFIEKTSLAHTTNSNGAGPAKAAVSLMTLHSSKGLEFPVVFIVGVEEGILPYFKAIGEEADMHEERRLFYVGMTRAKDILCLNGVKKRKMYSKVQDQEPSRFLNDIPKDCCHWVEKTTVVQRTSIPPKPVKIAPKRAGLAYVVGSKVKHPAWGIGIVRDCCGDGEDLKVTVNFSTVGLKKLSVRHVHLEKI